MMRRAFTLVEVLTVVAIVAVLAGVAFPVFGAVRRRAGHAACAENLHGLGLAVTLYAGDHEGWVPPATTAEFPYVPPKFDPAEVRASPEVLRHAMDPYVNADAVWFCPADAKAHQDALWLGQRHLRTGYFFFPRNPAEPLLPWPPRMQIGRDPSPTKPADSEDIPLFADASGLPWIDSDPPLQDADAAMSNHPDALVNAIRHDLSLSRRPAKEWEGSEK